MKLIRQTIISTQTIQLEINTCSRTYFLSNPFPKLLSIIKHTPPSPKVLFFFYSIEKKISSIEQLALHLFHPKALIMEQFRVNLLRKSLFSTSIFLNSSPQSFSVNVPCPKEPQVAHYCHQVSTNPINLVINFFKLLETLHRMCRHRFNVSLDQHKPSCFEYIFCFPCSQLFIYYVQ